MTDRPTKRPTLKTIADLTGMAVPTVSRALSDAPDIGQKTKDRVREVARQIGYVPNRAGVRLKTGKTNVISLVLSTDHDMMNHTARLISSIAGGLRGTPYHLIVTPYFPDEDPMAPVRYIVETRSADAVILNQIEPEDRRVAFLMKQGFPFATHGRTDWCARHAYFDFDNTAFGRIAAADLVRRDRREIAMLAPPLGQNYAQNMIDGAGAALAGTAARLTVVAGATSDDSGARIRAAAARNLAERPATDAVICASTTAAMAAVAALEAAGRRLGEDIDVYAKESVAFLKLFRPALLTVSEDVAGAGEFLARAAMQAVDRPDLPPMQGLDVPVAP